MPGNRHISRFSIGASYHLFHRFSCYGLTTIGYRIRHLGKQSNIAWPLIDGCKLSHVENSPFGCQLEFASTDLASILDLCAGNSEVLLQSFNRAGGLLVVKGLQGIQKQPQALVTLSRLFGSEVENYRNTLTSERFFHDSVDEILILSNAAPCHHPPPPGPVYKDQSQTELSVQFPQQINWHTDQSYRRPPPDITLLLAIEIPPANQGQTLFADCTAAFAALEPELQQTLKKLQGIHAPSWIGRSRAAVENGESPIDLLPHQLPQRHPLVRKHPVTGELSLYICEEKQMDYVDGPVVGLGTGPDGEGARLIRDLLVHATQPEFVYCHEWQAGDLLIADNRNLLHCATWYDAEQYSRLMWRTTVMGNPGDEYKGESKSWIPKDGSDVMAGMEYA